LPEVGLFFVTDYCLTPIAYKSNELHATIKAGLPVLAAVTQIHPIAAIPQTPHFLDSE